MSTTPKAVRRNGGSCVCPWEREAQRARYEEQDWDEGKCRYGYCFSARCRKCGGEVWGVGPVVCKCEGAPRWARHSKMAQIGHWDFEKDTFIVTHVAIKPSIRKRQRGRGN